MWSFKQFKQAWTSHKSRQTHYWQSKWWNTSRWCLYPMSIVKVKMKSKCHQACLRVCWTAGFTSNKCQQVEAILNKSFSSFAVNMWTNLLYDGVVIISTGHTGRGEVHLKISDIQSGAKIHRDTGTIYITAVTKSYRSTAGATFRTRRENKWQAAGAATWTMWFSTSRLRRESLVILSGCQEISRKGSTVD